MNKNTIGAIAVQNTIIIIIWMLFAVFFNKWWIALFSILFLRTIKNVVHKQYRVCDGCGKHSPYADSYNEALEKAKLANWVHITEGNRDYCPECRKELNL